MCECITKINTSLESHNCRVSLPWIGLQRPFVELIKIDEKKRGKVPYMQATYCPFCGEKYPAHRAGEGE